MARAPFQVFVYPYRRTDGGGFEFSLLRRSEAGCWKAIAGGGEDSETPLEAAWRESWEEGGIPFTAQFLRLETIEPV